MTFNLDYHVNYQVPTLKAGVDNVETKPKNIVEGQTGDKSQEHDSAVSQFGNMLEKNIEKVASLDKQSDALTQQYASGGNIPLHQVMIASEKASVAMNLTLQIRNKLVSAYQEMMRMPL